MRITLRAVPFSPKLLNEGEDVVLDLHPHWVYFLKSALLFVVAVAIGVLLLALGLGRAVDASPDPAC